MIFFYIQIIPHQIFKPNLLCIRLWATSWEFPTAHKCLLCLLKTPQLVILISSVHTTKLENVGSLLHLLMYQSEKRSLLGWSVAKSPCTYNCWFIRMISRVFKNLVNTWFWYVHILSYHSDRCGWVFIDSLQDIPVFIMKTVWFPRFFKSTVI